MKKLNPQDMKQLRGAFAGVAALCEMAKPSFVPNTRFQFGWSDPPDRLTACRHLSTFFRGLELAAFGPMWAPQDHTSPRIMLLNDVKRVRYCYAWAELPAEMRAPEVLGLIADLWNEGDGDIVSDGVASALLNMASTLIAASPKSHAFAIGGYDGCKPGRFISEIV